VGRRETKGVKKDVKGADKEGWDSWRVQKWHGELGGIEERKEKEDLAERRTEKKKKKGEKEEK